MFRPATAANRPVRALRSTSRARVRRRAFTLPELLVALTLLASLSGLGGFSYRAIARQTLRQQAETVKQILMEARSTAMRSGNPVRIAFSLPSPDGAPLPQEEDAGLPSPAIAGFSFTLPETASQIPLTTMPASGQLSGAWFPATLTSLPEGLLGRWTALPSLPNWLPLDGQVILQGELFTRFHEQSPAVFASENLTLPPHFHALPGRRLHGRECAWNSPYPADYLNLPHPSIQRPSAVALDDKEVLPDTGKRLNLITGVRPVLHYPAASRTKSQLTHLPVLEFLPDGTLSATWSEEIRLRFTSPAAGTARYELVIHPRAGTVILSS